MSYQPLAKNEKEAAVKEESIRHRNPLYPNLKYPQPKPTHTLESEITSSLLFQQLIYFNWYYSILECYLYAGCQIYRFLYFSMQYGVPVRTIVGVIFLLLEIFRLQNAFYGNIKESFPQICAFTMLTILTTAGQVILISQMTPPSPLQFSLLLYGIIFHLLEFIVCLFKMGKLTQSQKALFLWKSPLAKLE